MADKRDSALLLGTLQVVGATGLINHYTDIDRHRTALGTRKRKGHSPYFYWMWK